MLIHNALITGSLTINGVPYNTGSFTGSFYGDGSQLSGVTSYTDADTLAFINSLDVVSGSIQTVSTVSDTFTSVTSYTVTHNFGTKEVIVSVYENDILIFPSSINTPTINTVTITFPEPVTGRIVVVKAGHIVSGSINYNSVLNKPTLVSGSSQISFTGITNKPTLVSGSSQITYSGLTGIPSGIVSGSSQVTYSGLTGIPSGIVSGSTQVAQFGYATTGSNQFKASQAITGSLTVTGAIVAQTLNVQQVTSSIVYSSGSNRFGNNTGNIHQFTGSVNVTGSLTVAGAGTFSNSVTAGNNYLVNNPSASKKGYTYQSPASNWGPQVSGLYFTPNNAVDAKTTFTVELWNGVGSIITPLTITDTGAATFSSSVTANSVMSLSNDGTYGSNYKTLGLTGTTNGTHRIFAGTSDDLHIAAATSRGIIFWTNGVSGAKMTLTSGGNVGIGADSPNQKLEVNGRIRVSTNGSNGGDIGVDDSGLAFSTQGTTPTIFFRNNYASESLRITSGGSVGIGNSSPQAKLDLGTSIGGNYRNSFFFYNDNNGGSYHGTKNGFYMDQFSLSNNTTLSFSTAAGAPGTLMFASKNTNVNDSTSLTPRMTILGETGNVIIGSSSTSTQKLLLQGNLSMSGFGLMRTYYAESTTLGAQFDIFRFLTDSGAVFATSGVSGILFLNAQDTATSGNQISYTFHFQTNGNGTSQANITQMSFQLRGTQPIQSIGLQNDGGAGAVKVVGSVVGSGVSGCRVYATFVGVTTG